MSSSALAGLAILISLISALGCVASFYVARRAQSAGRYYDRWADLAKLVVAYPDELAPLWVSGKVFEKRFSQRYPPSIPLSDRQRAFAEIYIDFVVEVNRRVPNIEQQIAGGWPGAVAMTNPLVKRVWSELVNTDAVADEDQMIVRRVLQSQSTN